MNAVVRRCTGENGLLAWKRLCTSLNPRTLASGVKAINQVIILPKISDPKKMDVAIEQWEDKAVKLMIEYNETISNKLKLAALYRILPKEFQEKLLDRCSVNWDTIKEEEAEKILTMSKDEFKNIAKSRKEACRPVPMECDAVGAKEETEWGYPLSYDEVEIDNIGKGFGKGGKVGGKGGKGGDCYFCEERGALCKRMPEERIRQRRRKNNGRRDLASSTVAERGGKSCWGGQGML